MESIFNNVVFKKLTIFKDKRGSLAELFNASGDNFSIEQLNYVNSLQNTFRGMHLHSNHVDYLVVLSGTMNLALKDCRKSSSTFKKTELHTLSMADPHVAIISPGIAHGFYFPENTLYCYGMSHPWNASEKLGFRWDAPDSGFNWPMKSPEVSERDARAGTFNELITHLDKIDLTYEQA